MQATTENERYLTEQIITYIGNKRSLLKEIGGEIKEILPNLGKDRAITCDLFSGSGIVARLLKQFSTKVIANDMEQYSYVINDCYLTNKEDFNKELYLEYKRMIENEPLVDNGIISTNYAPADDENIRKNERVFYTHENAVLIDTYRSAIDKIPATYQKFFISPLLYEASVHVNTSGVFKGFYKSKDTGIGKFGGDGGHALERIKGRITLKEPVFSNFTSEAEIYKEDANVLCYKLKDIDITYVDPPYNQHPYGSNYFMLNTIISNRIGQNISNVSGIPDDWNRSDYNKKSMALKSFDNLISALDSKYIIVSYNNEGFITYDEMTELLSKYGKLSHKSIEYNVFRGSRNLRNRNIHTTEYLFTLKK